MFGSRLQELGAAIDRLFPERQIYLRSSVESRAFVLSSRMQMAGAAIVAAASVWLIAATAFMLIQPILQHADETAAVRTKNYYERLISDRQARLDAAVARLSGGSGGVKGVAEEIARRHTALAMLLTEVKGGGGSVMAPISAEALKAKSPIDQIRTVQADQERMVAAAETYARTRADRLRMAFKLAGLDAASTARANAADGLGGPLIEAKDPSALAAVLDVDTGFAARIQHAAQDLVETRTLGRAAERLPLAKPVDTPVKTSGFGARVDPFTHHGAFHPGQDFAGAFMTPIESTAPGVVSFTGQRTGYGNVVEIDHGGGFKTRYAHLQAISVAIGQKVGIGQRIGAMGSTGRSTGVHLHYEVWENGRVQDPTRFLRAGDYVQQNN
jgi:murein DD-endopeptidase MepM/ murein hydrolase activator NlpD